MGSLQSQPLALGEIVVLFTSLIGLIIMGVAFSVGFKHSTPKKYFAATRRGFLRLIGWMFLAGIVAIPFGTGEVGQNLCVTAGITLALWVILLIFGNAGFWAGRLAGKIQCSFSTNHPMG